MESSHTDKGIILLSRLLRQFVDETFERLYTVLSVLLVFWNCRLHLRVPPGDVLKLAEVVVHDLVGGNGDNDGQIGKRQSLSGNEVLSLEEFIE